MCRSNRRVRPGLTAFCLSRCHDKGARRSRRWIRTFNLIGFELQARCAGPSLRTAKAGHGADLTPTQPSPSRGRAVPNGLSAFDPLRTLPNGSHLSFRGRALAPANAVHDGSFSQRFKRAKGAHLMTALNAIDRCIVVPCFGKREAVLATGFTREFDFHLFWPMLSGD